MPKAEKVKFEVSVERPVDAKGKSTGYGQLATLVKTAIENHGGGDNAALTGVRVKRIAD